MLTNAYGHVVELMKEIETLYYEKAQQISDVVFSFRRTYLHVDEEISKKAVQLILKGLEKDLVRQDDEMGSRAFQDLTELLLKNSEL